MKNHEDIELMLVEFAQNNKNIKRVFVGENFLKTFIRNHMKKIYALLWCGIAVSFGILMKIDSNISTQKKCIDEIENMPRTIGANKVKNLNIKIDGKNFGYIQCVTDLLKESKNPLIAIRAAAAILCKNKIIAEVVSLEKGEVIKIRCKLSEKQMIDLEKLSNKQMEIRVTKMDDINSEYEKIDESCNRNFGAEICIKLK